MWTTEETCHSYSSGFLVSAIFMVSGYDRLADPMAIVATRSSEWAPTPHVSKMLSIVMERGGKGLHSIARNQQIPIQAGG
jgi:hypothetical protein